jgi:predicted RNA binding protein YcfA (HicA-like mRNA interferase family)
MPKRYTVREMITLVTKDGWYLVPGKAGSHRQYEHENKPGKVTIAGKPSDVLPPKTARSIFIQAQIEEPK